MTSNNGNSLREGYTLKPSYLEKGIFSTIILLFTAILLWQTQSLGQNAKLVPLIIGIPLAVLLVVQVVHDWFPTVTKRLKFLRAQTSVIPTGSEQEVVQKEPEETWQKTGRRYVFVLWLALVAILFYTIGVMSAIAITLFIYLKFFSKESWKLTILLTSGVWIGIYILFKIVLEAQF